MFQKRQFPVLSILIVALTLAANMPCSGNTPAAGSTTEQACHSQPVATPQKVKHKRPIVINSKKYWSLPVRSMTVPAGDIWQGESKHSGGTWGYGSWFLQASVPETMHLSLCASGYTKNETHPLEVLLAEPLHTLSSAEIEKYKEADDFDFIPSDGEPINVKAHTQLVNDKTVLVKEFVRKDGTQVYRVLFNGNPDKAHYYYPCALTFESPPELYTQNLELIKDAMQTIQWHNEVRAKYYNRHAERHDLIKWGVIRQTSSYTWPIKYMQLPAFANWYRWPGMSIHPGYSFQVSAGEQSEISFCFSSSGQSSMHKYYRELLALPPHDLTPSEKEKIGCPSTVKEYTALLNGKMVLFSEYENEGYAHLGIDFFGTDDESCKVLESITFETRPELMPKYEKDARAAFKTIKWCVKPDPRYRDEDE